MAVVKDNIRSLMSSKKVSQSHISEVSIRNTEYILEDYCCLRPDQFFGGRPRLPNSVVPDPHEVRSSQRPETLRKEEALQKPL